MSHAVPMGRLGILGDGFPRVSPGAIFICSLWEQGAVGWMGVVVSQVSKSGPGASSFVVGIKATTKARANAKATAKANAKATADPSTALRFAQDDRSIECSG